MQVNNPNPVPGHQPGEWIDERTGELMESSPPTTGHQAREDNDMFEFTYVDINRACAVIEELIEALRLEGTGPGKHPFELARRIELENVLDTLRRLEVDSRAEYVADFEAFQRERAGA